MVNPADINYSIIPIRPRDEDRTTFKTRQRRAEIFQLILAQGHTDFPALVLAERYGVSFQQIYKDKEIVIEYISKNYFKPNKIKSAAIAAKQRALKGALEDRDWKAVNQIASGLLEIGFDLGIIEKNPDKIEMDITQTVKYEEERKMVLEIVMKNLPKENRENLAKELKKLKINPNVHK